jgi:adenylosuccinate synthase
VTKLDVLDGLETIRLAVAYRYTRADGVVEQLDMLPFGADEVGACEAVFEEVPGWTETTAGIREWSELPVNARRYLERMSELTGAPIDLVSTGPDRDDTIVLRHPFRS